MIKIELICDGNGTVLVFINGQPKEEFYIEHSLPMKLENLLEDSLCKYKPARLPEDDDV